MYEQTRLYGRERGMEWVYEGVMFKMGNERKATSVRKRERRDRGSSVCTCAQTINEPHLLE